MMRKKKSPGLGHAGVAMARHPRTIPCFEALDLLFYSKMSNPSIQTAKVSSQHHPTLLVDLQGNLVKSRVFLAAPRQLLLRAGQELGLVPASRAVSHPTIIPTQKRTHLQN